MAEVKHSPVKHDHKAVLARARARPGFSEAYDALELEYELANQLLKARARWPYSRCGRRAHGHYQERNFTPGRFR